MISRISRRTVFLTSLVATALSFFTLGVTGARPSDSTRAQIVAEIKEELESEMGLLPVQLLRDRRASFVELYSYDNLGKTNYGTAGYLGHGYFITVKHAVVALADAEDETVGRKIVS